MIECTFFVFFSSVPVISLFVRCCLFLVMHVFVCVGCLFVCG